MLLEHYFYYLTNGTRLPDSAGGIGKGEGLDAICQYRPLCLKKRKRREMRAQVVFWEGINKGGRVEVTTGKRAPKCRLGSGWSPSCLVFSAFSANNEALKDASAHSLHVHETLTTRSALIY